MPQIEGKLTPMDWSSFAARRKLDIKAWVAHHRFKTYADVKRWCKNNSVQAPTKAVVSSYLLGKKKVGATLQDAHEAAAAPQASKKKVPPRKKKPSIKKPPDSIVG